MRIILAGSGTGGSVSAVMAVAQEIKTKNSKAEFLFIGSVKGCPEKKFAKMYNIRFCPIFCGKFRRYISIRNFIDPFLVFFGFIQSFFIILNFRPNAIFSAGGFVAVPVSFAAWLLRVPIFIHQQDIIPSLTNKIICWCAKKISVSFERSLKDFSKKKTVLTGNPSRLFVMFGDKVRARDLFNLEQHLPTVLIIGGGNGSLKINMLISQIISDLVKICQIIHITGKNKIDNEPRGLIRYHKYEFLKTEIKYAYAAADIVVSRAGMGTLTELAILGKPSIIIPMPDSHQENNALYFKSHNAAVILDQKILSPQKLFNAIQSLILCDKKRDKLSLNILKLGHLDAGKRIANLIIKNI